MHSLAGGCAPDAVDSDRRTNPRLLLISLFLQLGLAIVLGHTYDTHVFMATGYLVGTGQNPYVSQDLSLVMQDASFQSVTAIGYLPPWPLALGVLYLGSYALVPNLLLYNLAIKLPIIAANIGLAYLVAHILRRLHLPGPARNAWGFLILSPALLYFGSAWGQFDAIIACLSLASLVLLEKRRWLPAAGLLALAVAAKPIALPLLPVSLAYLGSRSLRDTWKYAAAFAAGFLLAGVAPFALFGWSPDPIVRGWNAHFIVGGGMSLLSFLEALRDSFDLGNWWLLGLAWIPALGLGFLTLRRGIATFSGLLKSSLALTLIFFLSRAWLSEPNTILLLPLLLILASMGEIDPRALAAVAWLPLIFTAFNASPPQLLYPAFPKVMQALMVEGDGVRHLRLIAKGLLAIPWQLAGWWIVVTCLRQRPPLASVEMAKATPRLETAHLERASG